jgi:hypothetical protein
MNSWDIDNLEISPLEKLKLNIDHERLINERRKTCITFFSIVISLILGIGTICYGIYSENRRDISAFELKAVEIVMNASSPKAAANKAVVLSELFPGRLPKGFKDKMLDMYGGRQQEPGAK